jgi:hypothetical protein
VLIVDQQLMFRSIFFTRPWSSARIFSLISPSKPIRPLGQTDRLIIGHQGQRVKWSIGAGQQWLSTWLESPTKIIKGFDGFFRLINMETKNMPQSNFAVTEKKILAPDCHFGVDILG